MDIQIKNFGEIEFNTIENIEHPEKYLLNVSRILNKHDVKWFLSFGTALGFYREKDFIRKDTDIDINVIEEDQGKIEAIIEDLEKEYPFIRSVSADGKQMQAAFQDFSNNFIVDICFFYRNESGYYSYCEGGMWQDKKEYVGSTQLFKTKYGYFPMPEKIEAYLEDRYGDWQTPKYGAITSSIKA